MGSTTNSNFCSLGKIIDQTFTAGFTNQYQVEGSEFFAKETIQVSDIISKMPAGGATVKVTATLSLSPHGSQSLGSCWVGTSDLIDIFYVLKNGVQVGPSATAHRQEAGSGAINQITTLEVYVPVVNGDRIAIGEKIINLGCGPGLIMGIQNKCSTNLTVSPGYY